VQRHNEQRSTGRSRCLEQLSDALDQASNLLLTMEFQEEHHATAVDVHLRMQIARLEAESLKRVHRPGAVAWPSDIDVALWPAVAELALICRDKSYSSHFDQALSGAHQCTASRLVSLLISAGWTMPRAALIGRIPSRSD